MSRDALDRASSLADEALAFIDPLHNLARYLTGSVSGAEDLVQETFARALAAESHFTRGTNLKAWLFRILRNAFIDQRRRRRLDPTRDDIDLDAACADRADDGEYLRGDRELEHLRRIVGSEIEAAIMSLSDDARTVILLDLEGLSEVEAASVLGCAVGTVKSRLARARAALRQRLQEYGE